MDKLLPAHKTTNVLLGQTQISLNPSHSGQNGRHYAEDVFKCIFVIKKFCILIQISLKFVPLGQIGNDAAMV